MWHISNIMGLLLLFIFSYIDIRLRKVPVRLLIFSNMAAFAHHLIFRDINLWVLTGGILVGALFLFVSKATNEEVGYGDSWGILILGTYMGIWGLLEVLSIAFLFLGAAAGIVLCNKRMSRKCALPFFPFLTGGYIVTLMLRGGGV